MSVTSTRRTPMKTTVWLVDDEVTFRESLSYLLNMSDSLLCERSLGDTRTLIDALSSTQALPDIVLLDIYLPGRSGIDSIADIKRISPGTGVIMLSISEKDRDVVRSIAAGADGFIQKASTLEFISEAIRQVREGGSALKGGALLGLLRNIRTDAAAISTYRLTKREREILRLIITGMSMNQIANELFVSVHTMVSHFKHIYKKLGCQTRASVVAKVIQERLV